MTKQTYLSTTLITDNGTAFTPTLTAESARILGTELNMRQPNTIIL